MSIDLQLHGKEIHSIFELLGYNENDITYSLGWALSRSPLLCAALLSRIFPDSTDAHQVDSITLQTWGSDTGVTDVEIVGERLHVVIEAKRGWVLPTQSQLAQYRHRFQGRAHQALVTMSECSMTFASLHLPKEIEGLPVVHVSWPVLRQLAHGRGGTHSEKRLLSELRTYLGKLMKIQNQESNLVYIVVLNGDTPEWSSLSWRQIVEERGRYFHPIGPVAGWPKTPPNYIAFRHTGRLQSIHHIEAWKIVTDIHAEMPELSPGVWENPHYLYTLGPAITPPKEVLNGKLYPNGRVWAMLDLLLTADTISEARDKTKERTKVPDEH